MLIKKLNFIFLFLFFTIQHKPRDLNCHAKKKSLEVAK